MGGARHTLPTSKELDGVEYGGWRMFLYQRTTHLRDRCVVSPLVDREALKLIFQVLVLIDSDHPNIKREGIFYCGVNQVASTA